MFKQSKLSVTTAGLLYGAITLAHAGDDDFFGDIDTSSFNTEAKVNEPLSTTGWFKQVFGYGLADPRNDFARSRAGMNKVESSLQLQTDWQASDKLSYRFSIRLLHDAIYQLDSDLNPSREELSDYENRIEYKDIFVDAQLSDKLYLRFGNQIIAWGEAETLAVTDVVSLKDNRTFGQADLEDTRLQVPAAKLSYYFDGFMLEGVITHNVGSDEQAPAWNEFDPFIGFRQLGMSIATTRVRNDQEYFLRLRQEFSGGEWSLVLADANANELSLSKIDAQTEQTRLIYSQDRFQVLGISGNWTQGLWIFKAELGTHFDVAMAPKNALFFDAVNGWQNKNQLRSVLGFEYVGFGDASVTFELDYIRTSGDVEGLSVDKNQLGFNTRVFWQDENSEWTLQGDWTKIPDNNGDIFRASVDYAFTDAVKLGASVIAYQAHSADRQLYNYRNNDVIKLSLKYAF